MNTAWIILFFLSAGGLFHSYLFYPLLLSVLSRKRRPPRPHYGDGEEWPQVSVLLSVYNEEAVIAEKLQSLFASDYPGAVNYFIGSDASSDRTHERIRALCGRREDVFLSEFPHRRGKPSVLNDLARLALERKPPSFGHIFLITDANVFLEPATLKRLIRHFKDSDIGLVDAHMINTGLSEAGISRSETQYIRAESLVKNREGQLWGAMIGPFGGCYALRSDLFEPIPPHFLVDDFYLAMRAFEKGALAINDLEAICYEAVSHELREEFRRKARIAAGNFQNLLLFWRLWFPPFSKLGFAFFSHKVLRWMGPFLLFMALLSSLVLALAGNPLFAALLLLQLVVWVLFPLADRLLLAIGVHLAWLRGVRYFLSMNLALLAGFFRFLRGVRSGAWEPTKRV
jgi:cellulose synthase/poly-beta-1,6-N-acetylglucosamine synthase-like glycosyltransferase